MRRSKSTISAREMCTGRQPGNSSGDATCSAERGTVAMLDSLMAAILPCTDRAFAQRRSLRPAGEFDLPEAGSHFQCCCRRTMRRRSASLRHISAACTRVAMETPCKLGEALPGATPTPAGRATSTPARRHPAVSPRGPPLRPSARLSRRSARSSGSSSGPVPSAAPSVRPTLRNAAMVASDTSRSFSARWISCAVQPGNARLLETLRKPPPSNR